MHSSSIQVLLPTNCPSYDFSSSPSLLFCCPGERLLQSIKHILIHLSNLAAGPHGHSLWPQYRSFTVVQASLASIETQPFIHPLVCTCCPWDPRDGPCSTPPCSQWYSYRSPLLWPETLGGHGSSHRLHRQLSHPPQTQTHLILYSYITDSAREYMQHILTFHRDCHTSDSIDYVIDLSESTLQLHPHTRRLGRASFRANIRT